MCLRNVTAQNSSVRQGTNHVERNTADVAELGGCVGQWYSTFFVRVPPDIISPQLCTPKAVCV
jgi:hypothetical protein